MIYLVSFGISVLLIKIKVKGRGNGVINFIALILPCALAGLRANSVGTDTGDYPLTIFNLALQHPYLEYMNTQFMHMWVTDYVRDMGVGYASFVFVITKLFRNFGILLFFTQVLIVFNVYGAVKKACNEKFIWLGMLVFYLLYYNVSLNAIRQWMAMAILLFAYVEFLNKKKSWIFIMLLGISFHTTAVCGLLVFLLDYLVNVVKWPITRVNTYNRFSTRWLLIAVIMALCLYFMMHMNVVRRIIGVTSMANFLNYFTGSINISIKRIVLELPLVVLCVINWKYFKENKNKYFIFVFSVISLLLSQLNTMNVLAWRIAAYVSMYNIIYYPVCIQGCLNKGKRSMEIIAVILYGMAYWMYYFAIMNSHGTLPYILR